MIESEKTLKKDILRSKERVKKRLNNGTFNQFYSVLKQYWRLASEYRELMCSFPDELSIFVVGVNNRVFICDTPLWVKPEIIEDNILKQFDYLGRESSPVFNIPVYNKIIDADYLKLHGRCVTNNQMNELYELSLEYSCVPFWSEEFEIKHVLERYIKY